jgi:uncharacterized membrane protein YcaP (DUF421 family)
MDAVVRAVFFYFFLLLVFRLSGQRTLANMTTFDFVLLLVIAEATLQGLIGEDFSMTQAVLMIVTLVALDIGLSLLKEKFPKLDKLIEGVPLVIVEDGKPLQERMQRARINESDVLVAARELQGIERLDQIRYVVLERTGEISIIPKPSGQA